MSDNPPNILLTLSLVPALEEPFVDWLLENTPELGFTSTAAHGHGVDPARLSVIEQVTGKQRRVEFRVVLPESTLDTLLARLHAAFAGADIFFWVTPILRTGRFSDAS